MYCPAFEGVSKVMILSNLSQNIELNETIRQIVKIEKFQKNELGCSSLGWQYKHRF